MARTLVHLVRHAEVDNAGHVVYGRLPGFHLTRAGLSSATALGRFFREQDVRLVAASPLERAQETAQAVAAAVGLEVRTDVRLTEAANRFEGTRFGAAPLSRHPLQLRHLANPLMPTWGEHYDEQAVRMSAAVVAACEAVGGGAAVLVSHQAPIWSLRCRLTGRRAWGRPGRRECAFASVTSLAFAGEQLVSVSYAEPASFA